MHKPLTISVDKNCTSGYLFSYLQLLEVRRRFWSHRNPERNLVANSKLHNIQLLMQQIWEELDSRGRLDTFPLNTLLLLIQTGNPFSFNPIPTP